VKGMGRQLSLIPGVRLVEINEEICGPSRFTSRRQISADKVRGTPDPWPFGSRGRICRVCACTRNTCASRINRNRCNRCNRCNSCASGVDTPTCHAPSRSYAHARAHATCLPVSPQLTPVTSVTSVTACLPGEYYAHPLQRLRRLRRLHRLHR
jgi:hypothetical protein